MSHHRVTYAIVIQPGARVAYQRLRQADRTQARAVNLPHGDTGHRLPVATVGSE
jgi:hypothetical protein